MTFDLGLRLDHDTLSADVANLAPRIGFVFAPTRDNRTAIRGGFGVFFDKIPINVAIFSAFPAQTIASYAPDGITALGTPATFTHVAPSSLHIPYSLGWTLQLDRELRRNLLLRFGYEWRQADHAPEQTAIGRVGCERTVLVGADERGGEVSEELVVVAFYNSIGRLFRIDGDFNF